MKAMIFAAGLGSRLKPLTDTRPKALITVGGKTMLEHIILKLKAAGFDEIVINVHHFSNQILAFLEANQNFGIDIQISDETDCLLDTGGGLERAYYLLHHPEDMFTKEGETPYELIFENLMKGMDEEEIIERGLGIMRKECYLLHNVDILSNCDFESLMYYHQNSSNINATLLVSARPPVICCLMTTICYVAGSIKTPWKPNRQDSGIKKGNIGNTPIAGYK